MKLWRGGGNTKGKEFLKIIIFPLSLQKNKSTKNGIISFKFIKYCIDIGITWQQDGANIHRNPKFMDYLDKEFNGHVLGLGADLNGRGGHSWAPRSPDLTVLDFAIWPIMKSKVYLHPRPTTLEELEEKILQVVRELNEDPDLIRRCHQSVKKRAQLCLENNGSHFEYTK